MPPKVTGPKVTVYFKGILGISKREGVLQYANKHRLTYMAKGARSRVSVVDSYYSPFFVAVAGWGHPDPGTDWEPAEPGSSPGVSVQKSKYTSTDPRWVDDFLAGPGKGLKPLVMLKNGTFSNPGNIPEGPTESLKDNVADLSVLIDRQSGGGDWRKKVKGLGRVKMRIG